VLISPSPDQKGKKLMFLSEWREFPSAPCIVGEKSCWQLASWCCWNRARPWQASELVSFLVGLRTYQHPGIYVSGLSLWLLNGSFLGLGTLQMDMLLPFSGRCSYAKVHAGVSSWNPVILKTETARFSETSACHAQCQVLLRTSVLRTSTKLLPLTAATFRVLKIQIIQQFPRPQ